jgi:hypothetical protein
MDWPAPLLEGEMAGSERGRGRPLLANGRYAPRTAQPKEGGSTRGYSFAL